MVRLSNDNILCSYTRGSNAYVQRSRDEGRSWQQEIKVAESAFGIVANPELLVLQNGWVLLSYNERPTDGTHPYTIRMAISKDNGITWGDYQLLYEAGTVPGSGCWEPAQIQLPSGEIQLFFSNEEPYAATGEQEITLIRSFDNGATWSSPQTVSFRARHRDGMPVPLILAGQNGIVISIEDNGLNGTLKPAIVYTSLAHNWAEPYADGDSPRRWGALQPGLPSSVYAGAPYIRQFPGGETVLSVQSGEGRMITGTLDYGRMVVYVGDSNAQNFKNPSIPFSVAPTSNGLFPFHQELNHGYGNFRGNHRRCERPVGNRRASKVRPMAKTGFNSSVWLDGCAAELFDRPGGRDRSERLGARQPRSDEGQRLERSAAKRTEARQRTGVYR
jgi:hypothetical protein